MAIFPEKPTEENALQDWAYGIFALGNQIADGALELYLKGKEAFWGNRSGTLYERTEDGIVIHEEHLATVEEMNARCDAIDAIQPGGVATIFQSSYLLGKACADAGVMTEADIAPPYPYEMDAATGHITILPQQ